MSEIVADMPPSFHRARLPSGVVPVFLCTLGLLALFSTFAADPSPTLKIAPQPQPISGVLPGLITDLGSNQYRLGQVILDTSTRTLTFPTRLNQTNVILEYAVVHEQGKTHESLLSTTVAPRDVHIGCLLLGFKAYAHLGTTNELLTVPPPGRMAISLVWTQANQRIVRPLQDLIGLAPRETLTVTGHMARASWVYSGSIVREGVLAAEEEGSIITLIRDPTALIQNPGIDRDDDDIHIPVVKTLPPPEIPLMVQIQRVD